jgi:[CysO sulfur-carrier protein]-S-L-cysteine hydrolase
VTPELPPELGEVLRHLEGCYPAEGCGVILRGPRGWVVRPMVNVYDRYHAADPERFPRTSRTAYLFDPKEWLRVSEQADSEGQQVMCVFHSHADVGAYFSREDREMAAPDGEPLLPGVSYLVVAVDSGKATAAKLFWWVGQDFREHAVPLAP